MFDKHKRESLLLRDLLKKLIIIVIGSIVAAYGITLALYAGFGAPRSQCYGRVSLKRFT